MYDSCLHVSLLALVVRDTSCGDRSRRLIRCRIQRGFQCFRNKLRSSCGVRQDWKQPHMCLETLALDGRCVICWYAVILVPT